MRGGVKLCESRWFSWNVDLDLMGLGEACSFCSCWSLEHTWIIPNFWRAPGSSALLVSWKSQKIFEEEEYCSWETWKKRERDISLIPRSTLAWSSCESLETNSVSEFPEKCQRRLVFFFFSFKLQTAWLIVQAYY